LAAVGIHHLATIRFEPARTLEVHDMSSLVSSEARFEHKGLAAVRMRTDEGVLVAVLLQVDGITLECDHLVADIAQDLGRVAGFRCRRVVAFR
jgi:hypothetical protein